MHRMDLAGPDPASAGLFTGSELWIGAMVPKRWARRAVTRNLIKRQLLALADLGGLHPSPAAYLVRLRSSFHTGQFISAASVALKRGVRAELQHLMALDQRKQESRS